MSCPGPNGAPGPTGPARTLAAWLLTLECVGAVEVAAGSELAVDVEPELTGVLVLVADVPVVLVAGVPAELVERDSEVCAAGTPELLDAAAD